jgi:hypothetical protein
MFKVMFRVGVVRPLWGRMSNLILIYYKHLNPSGSCGKTYYSHFFIFLSLLFWFSNPKGIACL